MTSSLSSGHMRSFAQHSFTIRTLIFIVVSRYSQFHRSRRHFDPPPPCLMRPLAFLSLSLPLSSGMVVRNVFGTDVNIEIDESTHVFPSENEILEMDKTMPGAQHGWFESSYNNSKLHYCYWLPEGEVKGIVIYHHGINARTGRGMLIDDRKLSTSLISDAFLKQGIALYTFDQYGHGFSEGTRFLIPESWEYNKKDCIKFANMVSEKHSVDIPLFIGGESYGGCLAIHTARHFQEFPNESPPNFDSILLSAPAIVADLPGFPVYHILKYILAPLVPKWTPFFMPHPVSPDRIWRDKKVLEHHTSQEYKKTGLDNGGSKLRLGTALNCVLALEEVRKSAIPGLTVPFCIVHGTKDDAVPIEGSVYMMENASAAEDDKELHRMEGAYHDLMSDPMAEEAVGHWMKFVQKRMEK